MAAIDTPLLQRHRLSVDDYHRMAEAGVLAPDARVELIEGEIVDMAAIGSRHWSVVNRLNRTLVLTVRDRAIVSAQSSIRLGRWSEPQPDLALLKPRADFYAQALPTAADALLVIEVSDTTAAIDRRVKAPLYARHGVAELWIIDLEASLVRFHRAPEGEHYADVIATEAPGTTPIALLPGVAIDLTGILA